MNNYKILLKPEPGFTLDFVEGEMMKIALDTTGFTKPELERITQAGYITELRGTNWKAEKVKSYLEKLLGNGIAITVEKEA